MGGLRKIRFRGLRRGAAFPHFTPRRVSLLCSESESRKVYGLREGFGFFEDWTSSRFFELFPDGAGLDARDILPAGSVRSVDSEPYAFVAPRTFDRV